MYQNNEAHHHGTSMQQAWWIWFTMSAFSVWMAESSLAHSNNDMSANCFLAPLDKVLTISHAYMHHILFQPCSAALYLSRCVTLSVQVSLQTNIQYSFHVPFPFTATSGESLVSRRDGWLWTRTMGHSDYRLLRCIGAQRCWGVGR